MSTCTHIWTWLSAARSEAILARHPRIEETDLLLGLLAQGGPVARTLGAAGVGLARARSAATDLDDADLAGANIPVPRGLRPRRLLVSLAVVQADVDLDLAPGDRLAVVGPSGVGKTTLLATLVGLLEPRDGELSLDGAPPWSARRTDVASRIILTAEDAHVFATTVLENLRVARPDVTEEEAVELLDRAGLGGWLGDLPEGVHTLLGADATTMSGGERRRLLFARALASPADYLLLDEPAEHLDSDTADALVADLLAAGKAPRERERTVVLVTHRLTPLWQADRVILLSEEDGRVRVAAAGKHEELANLIPDYHWSLRQEL
mgnify:CR=1 FL=1